MTHTTEQQRLRALIEDPRTRARWAARSRRRRAVIVLGILVLISAVLFALTVLSSGAPSHVLTAGFLACLALTAYTATKINIAARWVATYRGLDEFQRSESDRAAVLGYHVTSALLVLVLVAAGALGALSASLNLSGHAVLAVLSPLILVTALSHASFPACYLAWTRPDEILDDEDEPVTEELPS